MPLNFPIGIDDFRTLRREERRRPLDLDGADLRAAGAPVVHAFAVAFDGKKVCVAAGKKPKAPRPAKKTGASKQRG